MRNFILPSAALVALTLTGCAQESSSSSDAADGPNISSFSPVGGTYAALPGTVYVYFSESMDESSVENVANWTLACDGYAYSVSSVSLSGSVATIALPSPSWSDGTVCDLTASTAIESESGTALSGTLNVSYTLDSDTYDSSSSADSTDTTTSSSTSPTGAFLNPSPFDHDRIYGSVTLKASATAYDGYTVSSVQYLLDGTSLGTSSSAPYAVTFNAAGFSEGAHTLTLVITDSSGNINTGADTKSVIVANRSLTSSGPTGGSGGNAFTATASEGTNLMGLFLYTNSTVKRLTPIWQTAWGQSVLTSGSAYGSASSSDAFVQLTCPVGGNYRVSGVFGRSGSKIDQLGLICSKQDGSGSAWRSSAYGGSGGSAFELSCAAGSFVTEIRGRANSAVDQLQLMCK